MDSDASRAARREAQTRTDNALVRSFWEEHGLSVAALAETGARKFDVIDRFRLLFPAIDPVVVATALDASQVVFSKQDEAHHFPESALRLGVHYLVGVHLRIEGDPGAALVGLELDDLRALEGVLLPRGFSVEEIANILAVAAAVQEQARGQRLTLTKNKYMELRKPFVTRPRGEVAHPWPADAQTVMKRLGQGYWDDAMTSAGLGTSGRGRARGLLLFSEEDYRDAVAHFIQDRNSVNASTGSAHYEPWREREMQGNRSRPSLPAIRNKFETWQAAIRAATTAPQLRAKASQRNAPPAITFLHAARVDQRQALQEFESAEGISESDAAVRSLLTSYAQTFEIDRRSWMRSMILADPAAGLRRAALPKGALRRAHDELVGNAADPLAVIDDTYLDRLLSSGLGNVDGWLSQDVETELAPLNELTTMYELLRAARNYLIHVSDHSVERLRAALVDHAAVDSSYRFTRTVTPTTFIRWMAASDGARLREVVEVIPKAWSLMAIAEGVLFAEQSS
ncbi:hypothetical protein AX769_04035 [Frondihabitans sp. PAMC 28766]|uniref:hypothetical protein n=1 Tax=Frondihabitans sp. PAMC 28766 TaxID=1795630 RepID=UPI00078C6387|nr:hypothetical protein [Frondihabitans sp. PAMC 28766]AMM19462.1 hypothetical protein AX769_04035 [Frondihabitans sp. PAMC 28766]